MHHEIKWSLIVPLQSFEFYCVLNEVKPDLGAGQVWRSLFGTVVAWAFGVIAEQSILYPGVGFVIGMAGCGFSCTRSLSVRMDTLRRSRRWMDLLGAAFNTIRITASFNTSISPRP